MAKWSDVGHFLAEHYHVVEDSDSKVAVLMEFEDGRRQHITIYPFEAVDRTWLGFETRICRQEFMPPQQACRLNSELAVGHLALDSEGYYIARHTVLLGTLDPEELLVPLHVLTTLADDMEERLTGRDLW